MPDLTKLQALICEMYSHTSQGASTRQHVELTVSIGRVMRAPCTKRSPYEQAKMMQRIHFGISQDLLDGPAPREVLIESLQRWEGVKVK